MSKDVLKKINKLSDAIVRGKDALEVAGQKKRATYTHARNIQHLQRDRRALQGELSPLRVVENNLAYEKKRRVV